MNRDVGSATPPDQGLLIEESATILTKRRPPRIDAGGRRLW